MTKRQTAMIAVAAGLVLVLTAGAFYASPYISVSQLRNAVAERDSAAISSHVDFTALRESLKASLSTVLTQNKPSVEKSGLAALGAAMAATFGDKAIDTLVTPETVAKMMQGEKPTLVPTSPASEPSSEPIVTMGYEDFSTFLVTVRKPTATNALDLVFTRDGLAWKLSSVRLPP